MPLVYRVDIDLTICKYSSPRTHHDYHEAIPVHENIAKINKLYDEGHTIIYWTARGSCSGLDWTELTTRQLREWGAKHHEVYCNKPYYDKIIDDKALRIEEI